MIYRCKGHSRCQARYDSCQATQRNLRVQRMVKIGVCRVRRWLCRLDAMVPRLPQQQDGVGARAAVGAEVRACKGQQAGSEASAMCAGAGQATHLRT
jgi:hypothetical protein